jgi:hypothetical protein
LGRVPRCGRRNRREKRPQLGYLRALGSFPCPGLYGATGQSSGKTIPAAKTRLDRTGLNQPLIEPKSLMSFGCFGVTRGGSLLRSPVARPELLQRPALLPVLRGFLAPPELLGLDLPSPFSINWRTASDSVLSRASKRYSRTRSQRSALKPISFLMGKARGRGIVETNIGHKPHICN